MDIAQIIFAILMGFSLAATCGLRAFLPLLIIGIAAKTGYVSLAPGFEWMMSWPAIICFGSATVLEILGDKFPAVDHVLDAAGIVVRPVAGALAASSMIQGMDPLLALVIGIIMGATIAAVVQTIKGGLRIFSTATTGGVANPIISTAEDSATAAAGIMGILIPALAAALILTVLLVGGWLILGRLRRKQPARSTAPVMGPGET